MESMTKSNISNKEYLAFELGILVENSMQDDEMKENSLIAMAIKHSLPIQIIREFKMGLEKIFEKEFLESIPK